MAELTVQDVYQLAQKLSPQEKQELLDLVENDIWEKHILPAHDPLSAIVGAWADVGDDVIDVFDAEINRSRSQQPREVGQEATFEIEVQDNPFLALVGGWADMGDEGIDEFNRVIENIRQGPGCDQRGAGEDKGQP